MKHWYESKTMWFNAASLAVSVAGGSLLYVGELGLSDAQAGIAGLVLSQVVIVGNFFLRFKTTTGLK